jgi:monooxygenase
LRPSSLVLPLAGSNPEHENGNRKRSKRPVHLSREGYVKRPEPVVDQAPDQRIDGERHFDVLVVGAGLSGICAGYYLQTQCPGKRYAILEGRSQIGGTWDLFRYPGIRSDSDMFTMGFSFRGWKETRAVGDGAAILNYLHETAREFGIDRQMRFQHRVQSASWSSEDSLWTVEAEVGSENEAVKKQVRFTCGFLFLCSGYYDYKSGYAPPFEGSADFQGALVHPQHWPEDLDYRDKRVIVIGSGATAVTLVPAMASQAAHVTMLQRSPTYIASLPSVDSLAGLFRKVLPQRTALAATRWKNILLSLFFYQLCRRAPGLAKRLLRRNIERELPPDFDIETHFKPSYEPWDQRVCLVPDADLFQSIKAGRVSVVTDHIVKFTKHGILLESGQELPADMIVTATGLNMLACGGIRISVDGTPVVLGQSLAYKGVMLNDVPNCGICVGYINASWTLRADLSCAYVCRLLNYMERHGYKKCVPRLEDAGVRTQPLLGLKSGYVRRGIDHFPKQGSKAPWVFRNNYLYDILTLRFGAINDGILVFSKAGNAADTKAREPSDPIAAGQAASST